MGAKPASALKAAAWSSAQATDCDLKSRLRKSISVWGLSLPSLSLALPLPLLFFFFSLPPSLSSQFSLFHPLSLFLRLSVSLSLLSSQIIISISIVHSTEATARQLRALDELRGQLSNQITSLRQQTMTELQTGIIKTNKQQTSQLRNGLTKVTEEGNRLRESRLNTRVQNEPSTRATKPVDFANSPSHLTVALKPKHGVLSTSSWDGLCMSEVKSQEDRSRLDSNAMPWINGRREGKDIGTLVEQLTGDFETLDCNHRQWSDENYARGIFARGFSLDVRKSSATIQGS